MTKKMLLLFYMCLCLTLSGASAYAFRLPDTGQHKCYDNAGNEIACPGEGQALHGQDAQYQGAEPSYRDNGNGTVTDLNTGLVWQQGDDHNNVTRTWQGACDYCDALNLGGKTDWRLPTKRELASLPIYGVFDPSINTSFFPGCRSSHYWSSSTSALSPEDAWSVLFSNGYVLDYLKTNDYYVRCVRSGP